MRLDFGHTGLLSPELAATESLKWMSLVTLGLY